MLAREKINALRKQSGMSTIELGKRLGVSQGTVSRYENGYVRVIPYDKLVSLGEIFQCPISDIVGDDPAYSQFKDDNYNEDDSSKMTELAKEDIELLKWYHGLSEKERAFFRSIVIRNRGDIMIIHQHE